MPKWYFSKERLLNRTPSRANGVDLETETRYRREGCRFIMDVGNKLGLRYDTMATGVIYFHRFYMKQSFKTFPRWVTACACLFLAGKVEETPKKCRDIIKVAKSMLSDHHFLMFGENPREEVMMYERVLLQTIKFDLQVDHPYAILLKIGKLLKGDKGKIQKLVQMAWTFVNDSLSTNLCLRRKPEVLAIAHLHLAGRLSSFDLKSSTDSPSNKPWWLAFNKECQESVVEEICDEMLELYGGKKKEKPVKTKEKIIAEKGDPSPNNSSTTSSPSVTNSPPFKKKKMSKSSEPGKSPVVTCAVAVVPQSGTAESKPRPVSAESKPLPLASISSAEPPVVENVSPAVTSDSLPVANPICISQTTTTTMCSAASSLVSQSSTNQTNTVSTQSVVPPSQVPAGSLVNPVVQQHSFLSATYTAASYGIISQGLGTESVIPASTNSSYLQPTPQIDNMYAVPTNSIPAPQNPSNFGQTFPNVPPRLPISSHQAPPQVQPHQPPLHTHQPPPQPPPQPHHLPPQTHQPPPQPHQLPPQPPLQTHQCPPQPPHQPPPQAHQPPPQPRQLYQHPHTLPPPQNVPPIPLIPHVMNTQMPPAVPGSNNPNWHSVYSRPPPNNQPMGGGGGWLR